MTSSSSDSELDMCSPLFDPAKALYAKNIKLPSETAQRLDNISKFEINSTGEVVIKPERARVMYA